METLRSLFQHGGVAMYLIAAGSVLSVGLALERLAFLRGFERRSRRLHERVMAALARGALDEALAAADGDAGPSAAIYREALRRAKAGKEPGGVADRERRRTLSSLRSGLWLQGTLGATMPFIGLFGTVVGVLESFGQIGKAGNAGFAVVSGSISEALITTAAGIAVAVEAVILYNVFNALAGARALALNLRVEELVEELRARAAVRGEAA